MLYNIKVNSPVWWNWQTRRTQNPVVAIPCGFDPRHRHQKSKSFDLDFFHLYHKICETRFLQNLPLLIREDYSPVDCKATSATEPQRD